MPTERASTLVLAICLLGLLQACDPVVLPPFVPPRDAPRFDADLDVPRPDVPPFDAPRPDVPRPDVPGADVPDEDGGDPDFDGGLALPITIDGVLEEIEWEDGRVAESTALGTGAFEGCELSSLRVLDDDTSIYLAIEGVLNNGAIVVYVATAAPGVNLALLALGDVTGSVDAVASRAYSVVEPTALPSFVWGTALMPAAPGPATDDLGWRALSQDGPHRHITVDLSACTETVCETRVPRSALGNPTSIRIAARLATPDNGSLLALPFESDADVSLLNFRSVSVAP